ncbi:GDSL-type esterase/lipase family protein [Sphaerisporangium sp. TRM90804]|uniref:GDSL-type esterase/lipase family protein n=1 Tax=Sphaerisporangium sp. TRM90804 TaxID=3031113 RepID=UPI00244C0B60|nr:GDSL-type esterase/lipase family protein [Sphaerisporangium sp. TRM90804]MDH2426196.1 GDSL-type esterase/lipase family protein [Sphaerisporangium sp. TRM90804]
MVGRIAFVLAAAVVWTSGTAAATAAEPVPRVMAALGDSISAGFNACGWYVSCTSRSWSAGDNPGVDSHYLRLLAIGPSVKGHNRNFAVPGSTSADLAAQAEKAVAAGAGYVTVLIGAQDACTSTADAMTPVSTYRTRVDRAFAVLARTGTKVFAASIPDVKRLWRVGRENVLAKSFWTIGRICQSMLANPGSTAKKDQARRDRVRERVQDYNAAMASACAAYGPGCRYDGGAVFSYPFTLKHVSKWDFFHPNADGQAVIARATFGAGFPWEPGVTAPEPLAQESAAPVRQQ